MLQSEKTSLLFNKIPLFSAFYIFVGATHTFLWYAFNAYTDEFIIFCDIVSVALSFLFYIKQYYEDFAIVCISIVFGLFGPFTILSMPSLWVIAVCTHYIGQMFTLYLQYTRYGASAFLVSNVLGWFVCFSAILCSDVVSQGEKAAYYALITNYSNLFQLLVGISFGHGTIWLLNKVKKDAVNLRLEHEQQLLSLNDDLKDTNSKLSQSNTSLRKAIGEVENFTLRFSHEIRNPLNSLLGNIDLCYESSKDSEDRKMLKDAKVSGEILLQLLNNVLDTSKIASSQLEVNPQPHNIFRFCERIWVVCSELIRMKNLSGVLAINHNVPEIIEFDDHRLVQILINMVSNSTKFTKSGIVHINIEFEVTDEIKNEQMIPRHAHFLEESEQEEADFSIRHTSELSPKVSSDHLYKTLTLRRKCFQKHQEILPSIEDTKVSERISAYNVEHNNNRSFGSILTLSNILQKEEPQKQKEIKIEQNSNFKNFSKSCHFTSRENKDGYLRIEIVDSGCGMKKEDLSNLFKKFTQVNDEASSRQIGTGLGLWITHEIIERMGGRVEVHSLPNVGTCFVIMLKTRSRSCLSHNQLRSTEIKSSKNIYNTEDIINIKRVLIVEDSPYSQEVVRRFLNKCGINDVTVANNGKEGFDIYNARGSGYFDVIFMDIDMPIMCGKTTTQSIREHEQQFKWNHTKIVILTAYAELKTQQLLLDPKGPYRADVFLSKPGSYETIKKTLVDISQENAKMNALANQRKKVLIADDDMFNLSLMAKMVTKCGLEPIEAHNGQELLDLYKKNSNEIKLLLTDCEMPVMNGFNAAQKINEYQQECMPYSYRAPIYGLTGHTGQEYRKKCNDCGMADMIVKPIAINRLLQILEGNNE